MKLLIVATNRERSPYPVAPLGALAVAAAAERAGHEVDLLDMMFVSRPAAALRSALRRSGYGAIGFSIRNLDNCICQHPRSYYAEVELLAGVARGHANVPLIVGGSGFSIAPQGWMKRLGAEYGVVGEGEQALVALLDRIENGRNAAAGAVSTPSPISELDSLPDPDHRRCAYSRYMSRGGFASVQSKRGCPFDCIYCAYPLLEGNVHRLRSPGRVADEVESLARDADRCCVFFTDSVFNAPRDHALAVCREMTRRGSRARWMAYCNPLQFDEELARAMAEAGCVGIEFGLDVATDKMLAAMGKPFTQSDIRVALAVAAAAGLPFALFLLFGGPGETAQDIREAQRFLDSCATPNAVFASLGIRIYAGTPMERIARRDGAIAPDADLFAPAYYVSPALGDDPMPALDEIARARHEWSTPTDWRKLSLRVIQRVVNRFGTRPQWRDVRNYGRYMR